MTSETAQGTQQIAHAAEDLNRLTDNLQNLISGFKVGGGRGDDPSRGQHSGVAVRENGSLVAG